MNIQINVAAQFNERIDFVRVTALIMMIILHVASINFFQFSDKWWATNVYDSLVRSCVPLFLMISGALLLKNEDSLSVFVRKRIVRIFPPLIFWSLIYLAIFKNIGHGEYSEWIPIIMSGPVIYHFWYLYAIIGLYAFVPLLKRIYLGTNDSEKLYLLAMWFFVASVFPTLKGYFNYTWDLIGTFNLGIFSGFVGYFFLGAYLLDHNKASNFSVLKWLAVFVSSSLVIAWMTYFHSFEKWRPDELFYNYLSPFVVVEAIALFNVCTAPKLVISTRNKKIFRLISECSLGIYCVHVMVLHGLEIWAGLSGSVDSPWWSIPATATATFTVSFVMIYLMRRFTLLRLVT